MLDLRQLGGGRWARGKRASNEGNSVVGAEGDPELLWGQRRGRGKRFVCIPLSNTQSSRRRLTRYRGGWARPGGWWGRPSARPL